MNALLKPVETPTAPPPGYLKNGVGHMVPISMIDAWKVMEHDLVEETFIEAEKLYAVMARFKFRSLGDVQAFIELVKADYGAVYGGEEGFVTLSNYSATRKIKIAIGRRMHFGSAQLAAAKELVHACIRRWRERLDALELADGPNAETERQLLRQTIDAVMALVEHAFNVDDEQKISPSRIWSMTRYKIKDEEWQRAMRAVEDAIRWEGDKPYIRFYRRVGKENKWMMLSLDMAAIDEPVEEKEAA